MQWNRALDLENRLTLTIQPVGNAVFLRPVQGREQKTKFPVPHGIYAPEINGVIVIVLHAFRGELSLSQYPFTSVLDGKNLVAVHIGVRPCVGRQQQIHARDMFEIPFDALLQRSLRGNGVGRP